MPHTDRFLLGEFSGSFEGWLVLHKCGLLGLSPRRCEESPCSVLALALCSVGTGLGCASSNSEGLRRGSGSPLTSNLTSSAHGFFRGLQSSFWRAHREHGARPAGGREGRSVPTCGIGVAWPQPQQLTIVWSGSQPWSARVLSADSQFRTGKATVVWPLGSAAETWACHPPLGVSHFRRR